MDFLFIGLWILITLSVGTISVLLGKRYGVAIPIAMMASLLGIAGALVNKIVVFGPFITSASVIVFSMTFLLTDLISEIWGKHHARLAVWTGFLVSITFLISTQIAIAWPPAPFALEGSEAFATLYTTIPRITLAGLIAYLIAQHLDVWLFHKIGEWTQGRHLWLRNNGSTLVSQFTDSLLFATIAFYGTLPLVPYILGLWIIKLIIAMLDTPFIYAGVYLFKKVPLKEKQVVTT